jgi:hypothetical protein
LVYVTTQLLVELNAMINMVMDLLNRCYEFFELCWVGRRARSNDSGKESGIPASTSFRHDLLYSTGLATMPKTFNINVKSYTKGRATTFMLESQSTIPNVRFVEALVPQKAWAPNICIIIVAPL